MWWKELNSSVNYHRAVVIGTLSKLLFSLAGESSDLLLTGHGFNIQSADTKLWCLNTNYGGSISIAHINCCVDYSLHQGWCETLVGTRCLGKRGGPSSKNAKYLRLYLCLAPLLNKSKGCPIWLTKHTCPMSMFKEVGPVKMKYLRSTGYGLWGSEPISLKGLWHFIICLGLE